MKRELRLFDELDRFARGGEIAEALAFTFGLDGDVAAERVFTPLIEKYGVRHPIVVASGVVDEGTALGVHVLQAPRQTGVFHPKLFLAVREDGVFAAIGSANLTRGGLGANLELVTTLVFGNDAERPPPPSVLDAILAFARQVVADLPVNADSAAKALQVIEAAEVVRSTLREGRRGPDLRFLTSYGDPIWKQLRNLHGDDPVQHLSVISPFFEVDDPWLDESSSLLRTALSADLPWAPRAVSPRCTLYSGALGAFMSLPRAALNELGANVDLRPQALSVEPRRLHGKLIAIFGKKRTTVLWGSPNFTPSALVRSVEGGGNVECALAMSMAASSFDLSALIAELDLTESFHTHRGPLPEESVRTAVAPPVFEVGELLYDPVTRILTVSGVVWSGQVNGIRARFGGTENSTVVLEGKVGEVGVFHVGSSAPMVEEEDPETGLRRLRSLKLVVEALDAQGQLLGALQVRINVRFEDALEVHRNMLLGPDALGADALLVPSTAPPEQRIKSLDEMIRRLGMARKGVGGPAFLHQASLDTFFRNVRRGLDARWEGLERRHGSRFALMRWARELGRSLSAATGDAMDGVRRAYLVARVSEHVMRVVGEIPRWHPDPQPVVSIMNLDELAEKLAAVPLSDGVRNATSKEVDALRTRVVKALRRAARGGPLPTSTVKRASRERDHLSPKKAL